MAIKITNLLTSAKPRKPSFPTIAIGRDTGTVYLMLGASKGVVLEGRTVLQGREGSVLDPSMGQGVEYAKPGTVFEIEVL